MGKKIIGLALLLAVVICAGAVGQHLFFGPNRYWLDDGTLRTDGVVQSYGASNGLKLWYEQATSATLALNSSGQLTLDAPINWAGITPAGTVGSLVTTGSTWVAFPTANACGIKLLLSNTATTGEFATVRLRARSNSVTPAVCGNFSASAGQNNHGDLYAVQGYAQPNAYSSATARYVVGLYSCIDRTTGGTSVGYDWSTWIDTHMQVKASGSSYLLRLSHNGTVANDGAITIYNGGRMPVLFNFEDAAGFLNDSANTHTNAAGEIAVRTPAGTKYLVLYN